MNNVYRLKIYNNIVNHRGMMIPIMLLLAVAIPVTGLAIEVSDETGQQTSDHPTSRKGPHGSFDPHSKLSPEKHIQVALQHRNEGRMALAMDTLNQALQKYPKHASLYGVRGSLQLEQGRSAAALADLNKAIELEPHDAGFLTNRAQAYRQFDRIKEAIADLDQAIDLDKNFVAARFNRGSLHFNAGHFEKALADFNACIQAEPRAAAPYFNRASVHEAMGNRNLAIADMKHFMSVTTSEQWKKTADSLLQKWESPAAKTKVN